MKNQLLLLFALAMCVGVNAQNQTRIYSNYSDAKSALTCELGTTIVKSVEYKTVTLSLEDNDDGTAVELYFKGDSNSKLNSVVREDVLKVQDEEEEPNYLYQVKLNKTSQFDFPFVNVMWNTSAVASITPFLSGKFCTVRLDKDATGTLEVDGMIANQNNQAFNLPYLTINLGGSSAISYLQADGTVVNKSVVKVAKNGQLIIVNNGKQYNAAGAQMK